ncbi:hypothetical protein AGMMS50267_12930 [Spirochaetia bacterium]|nr:hypothetical protein AGMMS50267_12930 [Spirochaetia bacterium]
MKKSLHILAIIAAGAVIMGLMGCASFVGFNKVASYDPYQPVAVVEIAMTRDIDWAGAKKQTGLAGLAAGLVKGKQTSEYEIGLAAEAERSLFAALEQAGIPVVAKDTVINTPSYQQAKDVKKTADAYVSANGYKHVWDLSAKVPKITKKLEAEANAKSVLVVWVDVQKAVDVGVGGKLATGNMYPRVTVLANLFNEKGKGIATGGYLMKSDVIGDAIGKVVDSATDSLNQASDSIRESTGVDFGHAEKDSPLSGRTGSTKVVAGIYDEEEFSALTVGAIRNAFAKFPAEFRIQYNR